MSYLHRYVWGLVLQLAQLDARMRQVPMRHPSRRACCGLALGAVAATGSALGHADRWAAGPLILVAVLLGLVWVPGPRLRSAAGRHAPYRMGPSWTSIHKLAAPPATAPAELSPGALALLDRLLADEEPEDMEPVGPIEWVDDDDDEF